MVDGHRLRIATISEHASPLALALGLLVARRYISCAAVHRRRAAERSESPSVSLQRWEGEGGSPAPMDADPADRNP